MINKLFRSLGMMSGTSIDGSVSAAIIETDGCDVVRRVASVEYQYEDEKGLRPIHHLTKAAESAFRKAQGDAADAARYYPTVVRSYIEQTFSLSGEAVDEKLASLIAAFGLQSESLQLNDVVRRSTEVHLQAARLMLRQSGERAFGIDYVGYHGQTLYHDPFFNHVTVQVGDAQTLANELRIPVVFDFRTNDVAHGGQGAPLAPVYHRALVRTSGLESAAILNLGGTANVTVVSNKSENMLGFDTGPANGLIDRYVKERTGRALDADSRLALNGAVSERALQALIARAVILKDGRNYLEIAPPKSLDIRDYTFDIPEFQSLSLEDGCATLNAFSAECVARSLVWVTSAGYEVPTHWVLCGGGAYSPHLRDQIALRLRAQLGDSLKVVSADDAGWSAQGMEAELFAYLAVRSIKGLPITFPGTTGVSEPLCGGRLYSPMPAEF